MNPLTSKVSFRFLNLAPRSNPLDVTLIRGTAFDTSSTSQPKLHFVATDSLTIPSQAYIGNNPDLAALAEFKYSVTGASGEAVPKAKLIANVPALNLNNRYIISLKQQAPKLYYHKVFCKLLLLLLLLPL